MRSNPFSRSDTDSSVESNPFGRSGSDSSVNQIHLKK